jgi:hypothetical protein
MVIDISNYLWQDLRFISEAQNGKVISEFEDVHPDTLQRYYATDGAVIRRPPHHTGAGHPLDEELEVDHSDEEGGSDGVSMEGSEGLDMESTADGSEEAMGGEDSEEDGGAVSESSAGTMQDRIAHDVRFNVNHPAVKLPRSHSPFTNLSHEASFLVVLDQVRTAAIVPDGYGVAPAEWDEDGYPTDETISIGRRARKLVLELPGLIWLPRAVVWAQGLHTMQTFLYQLEETHG